MLCCSLFAALLAQPLLLLTGARTRLASLGMRRLFASRSAVALGSAALIAELAFVGTGLAASGVVRLGAVQAGVPFPLHICKVIEANLP